ncbi:MAG: SagB/ThcOx family dehydrogenase [Armatimonadota bacterium]
MPDEAGIGPRYQENTKYYPHAMPQKPDWPAPTPPYKQYENPLSYIDLPEPDKDNGMSLWQAIENRRSKRGFTPEPVSLKELAQLLWATQGITGQLGNQPARATASAGALYPNETYLFVNNVADCPAGIYHYEVLEWRLSMLAEGEFGDRVSKACLRQDFCADAAVIFAWGAVVDRSAMKYGDRAYRYIHLDAGHLGGQLQLAATALGLGSVNVGAFFDDEVNRLLGLDGLRETVVYLTAAGKVAR